MRHLRILYIGTISGTCLDRANAYRRMGHEVVHLDMRQWLHPSAWIDRVTWRIGGHVFSPWLAKRMGREIRAQKPFDLCHVDNGEWVTPEVIDVLRQACGQVINYNIDDPTGPRDRARFSAYRRAAFKYDLLAVVREENVEECERLGASRVLRVWRSADEVSHAPRLMTEKTREAWQSEVLFLGTWMPERGPFLLKLIQLGVPLSIRGAHWQKAPEWEHLRDHWIGGPVSGDEYAYAIQSAKVNLGLLSKGNRDLHTTRSMEVPSLGGVLCAERTPEHRQLYQEGVEAVFWSTAQECASLCKKLLADDALRESLAAAGHRRYVSAGYSNQSVLNQIIEQVMA